MCNRSEPHAHILDAINRQQRVRRAGRNAWKVSAQDTGRLIRKEHRRTVGPVRDNRTGRTGLDAVTAFRAAFKKQHLLNSAWRTEPIGANRRGPLFGNRILLLRKFLRRFRDRQYGILQKIPPAV